jgi:hypothetical protein
MVSGQLRAPANTLLPSEPKEAHNRGRCAGHEFQEGAQGTDARSGGSQQRKVCKARVPTVAEGVQDARVPNREVAH